jgi:hypothetical protein
MLGARLRVRPVRLEALLVGVVLLEAEFAAYYAMKGTHWAVMTDELQNAKLATSISSSGSPFPVIHGQSYGVSSQLYPLLIAPFYGFLSGPGAVTASHALNALLMASAAWPGYLLGRAVTGSRAGACVVAVLTVLVPWMVFTTALLTENVAYPVFLWAVLAIYRSLASPSDKRGLVAVLSVALAFFARTQFFVLALLVPLALVLHELGYAAATRPKDRLVAASAFRSAVSRQRLLASASLLGVLLVGGLAAGNRLGSVLGNYGTTLHGGLVPAGLWHAAADHFNRVVVGIGIVPFLLAGAWAIATLIRPTSKQAHAFAVVLILLAPLLTLQVASFDLRFTPGAFAQERYLFYLAPLLFVGMVACILDRGLKRLRAGLLLALGLLFPWLAGATSYRDTTVIYWASPASAFHGAIATAAGWLALSADSLIRWGGAVAAVLLSAAVLYGRPRTTLAVVALTLAIFCSIETHHVFVRYALPAVTRPSAIPTARRDWIDAAVPADASVALVPNPYLGPEVWWDAEFWNKSVDRTLRIDDGPTYTPFPADEINIDFATGTLRGNNPARLLVRALDESRFHLADTTTLTATPPLVLVHTAQRLRLDWAVRGIYPDGWTLPSTTARLRFYSHNEAQHLEAKLTLTSDPQARKPQAYTLIAGGRTVRKGALAPGTSQQLTFPISTPAHAFSEANLIVPQDVRLEDGRAVGLHIELTTASATR